jgi:hypothetical protein
MLNQGTRHVAIAVSMMHCQHDRKLKLDIQQLDSVVPNMSACNTT